MLHQKTHGSGSSFKLGSQSYGFQYSTLLTSGHAVATFLGLLICLKIEMFTFKRVRLMDTVGIVLMFIGFVAFNNLSLQYNSVGFYQLMKVRAWLVAIRSFACI